MKMRSDAPSVEKALEQPIPRDTQVYPIGGKKELVRSLFETPDWYLKRTHNIRVRMETVEEFLKKQSFANILDIGCGDGSVSLPLLKPDRHLTLLDFSKQMLSVARSRIPEELRGNVQIINDDFMAAHLKPNSYDVIICVGVLAHADSPAMFLRKITSLLRPDGSLILEQTDSDHFVTDIVRWLEKALRLFAPEMYNRNQLTSAELLSFLGSLGFDLKASFRYSLPLPGMKRVISPDGLYKMIRVVYGAYPHARLSTAGNECLYHLKLESSGQR